MAAGDTGVGVDGQPPVVVGGQAVSGQGQVIILVDQPDVQPGGAGLAVVAVYAGALHVLGVRLPMRE